MEEAIQGKCPGFLYCKLGAPGEGEGGGRGGDLGAASSVPGMHLRCIPGSVRGEGGNRLGAERLKTNRVVTELQNYYWPIFRSPAFNWTGNAHPVQCGTVIKSTKKGNLVPNGWRGDLGDLKAETALQVFLHCLQGPFLEDLGTVLPGPLNVLRAGGGPHILGRRILSLRN